MKKIFSFLLILCLIFPIYGCNKKVAELPSKEEIQQLTIEEAVWGAIEYSGAKKATDVHRTGKTVNMQLWLQASSEDETLSYCFRLVQYLSKRTDISNIDVILAPYNTKMEKDYTHSGWLNFSLSEFGDINDIESFATYIKNLDVGYEPGGFVEET